jgi:hypothetical protein
LGGGGFEFHFENPWISSKIVFPTSTKIFISKKGTAKIQISVFVLFVVFLGIWLWQKNDK